MPITNIILYICSFFLLTGSLVAVFSKNTVLALISLISAFLCSSFILFILECEFLALLFIIIYVGAIAVLFLFAVMMLEFKSKNLTKPKPRYVFISSFFGIALFFFCLQPITTSFKNNPYQDRLYFNTYTNWYDLVDSVTDIETYGQILYSYFILQFLLVGLILLVVLVGVVYLTNSNNHKVSSKQSGLKQLSRNSKIFTSNAK